MKCPYCGAEVYEGARHCFACMTGLCSRKVIDIDVKAERRRRLAYIPAVVTGALACSVAAYGIANQGEGREIPTRSGELGNSSYAEGMNMTIPDSLPETTTTTTTKSTKPTTTMMTSYSTAKSSTTKKKTTATTTTKQTTKKPTTTQPVTQTAAPQQEEYYQEPQEEYQEEPQEEYQEETPPETVVIYETLPPETVIVYQEPEEEEEPEPDLYPDGATVYSKNAAEYIHNKYGVDVGYSGKFDVAASKAADEFMERMDNRPEDITPYGYFKYHGTELDPTKYYTEEGIFGVISHCYIEYAGKVYLDNYNDDVAAKIQFSFEHDVNDDLPNYDKKYVSIVAKKSPPMALNGVYERSYYTFWVFYFTV